MSESELDFFKEELIYKYELYYESVLNIIDDNIDINDKYRARSVLVNQFATTKSTVADYLDKEIPQILPVFEYSYRLFELDLEIPVYFKKYKFSDSIRVNKTVKGIKDEYIEDRSYKAGDKSFQVYEGELFFLERNIDSYYISEEEFDIEEKEDLKLIRFRIVHDENDRYVAQISSIQFVDKENILYDHDRLKEEVLLSPLPWSDVAEKEYFDALIEDAIKRGVIKVVPLEKKPEKLITLERKAKADSISLPVKKSVTPDLDKITFLHYVVPGIGHLKAGNPEHRKRDFFIYAGTFLAGSAWALNYKIRSADQFEDAANLTGTEKTIMIRRAERNKKRIKYGLITMGTSFAANIIHMCIKSKNRKKMIKESDFKGDLSFSVDGTGQLSLDYRF